MVEQTIITLPKTKLAPTKIVPSSLAIFGPPKCGKTTKASELEDNLTIDIEEGGEFVESLRVSPPKGAGPVAKFKWLNDIAAQIRAEGKPYKFVTIDTASEIDALAEWVGTYNYMNHSQGKKFNRAKDGTMLKPSDAGYESVHDLPEGYGYRWSRNAAMDMLDNLRDLGSVCTIFICHVADKFIAAKGSNTEVKAVELSLTGKVKTIFSRDVDAIGYVWNKDGVVNISFKGDENRLGGMRGATHLRGYEGPLKWEEIFLLDKN